MPDSPRIRDIAELSDVAPSTVSHVLNGTAPISEEVRQRVLAVARDSGYLTMRRRKAAVALLPTVLLAASEANFPKSDRNYVSWTMLNAFRQECRARTIRLIPHIEPGERIDPDTLLAAIARHQPQGVAIMQFDSVELIDAVHDLDPSVVILSGQDPSMRVDTVSAGDRYGAQLATDYLFRLGHRRVAYVTYGTRLTGLHRKRGFIEGYRESGHRMPPGALIEVENFQPEVVEQNMTNWLLTQPRPLPFTAFFCSADNVAIGVLAAFTKAGIKVPSDVSVLGFDNVQSGAKQDPPLSTVHVPMEEIGQAALNLLEEARTLPKKDRSARRVELGCSIVVRGSTAGPRTP